MTAPVGGGAASVEPDVERFGLGDGRTVVVRAVRPSDERLIEEFLGRLTLATRRLRFFTAGCNLREQAHRAAGADGAAHLGFVVVDGEGRIVGHACYVRAGGRRAEVAVEVADDLHHLGLGTHLVARLAQLAALHGIERFYAEVLPENGEMLAVFHDGFASTRRFVDGIVEVEFPTSNWSLAPCPPAGHLGQRRTAPRVATLPEPIRTGAR
ncbi:MAG TPA: GNAT family N-acetyltransferase [Solirubrobacteraceae bacterium]|nr:GNAT family N-acetyltransferase [Solirubrobacteraceae bacterium]